MDAHLIDIDIIKENGYTNTNVRDNIVATTLTRCQDIELKSILGNSFFDRLIEGVINDDLNANETTLLDSYIQKYLISAVDYRICIHLHTEIRAKTVGTTNDAIMQSADEKQMLKLEDELRRDREHYKNFLIGYLKDNEDLFPTYKDYVCSFEKKAPEKTQDDYRNLYFT